MAGPAVRTLRFYTQIGLFSPSGRSDFGCRLFYTETDISPLFVHADKLQLDLRTNPIAVIESPDLAAAIDRVRSKGAIETTGSSPEKAFSSSRFRTDPDGNGILVV